MEVNSEKRVLRSKIKPIQNYSIEEKTMKKVLVLSIMCLALAIAVPVFAGGNNYNSGVSANGDVTFDFGVAGSNTNFTTGLQGGSFLQQGNWCPTPVGGNQLFAEGGVYLNNGAGFIGGQIGFNINADKHGASVSDYTSTYAGVIGSGSANMQAGSQTWAKSLPNFNFNRW